MKNLLSALAFVIVVIVSMPDSANGQEVPAYAIENVTIHNSDKSIIQSGTIIWRDGVIEIVHADAELPFDAFSVLDGGDSLHVYPGFIDGLGMWGSPALPDDPEQPDAPGNPDYERAGIQPDRLAGDHLNISAREIMDVMKTGFTTANLGLKGYMLPGQPGLYFLNGEETSDFLFKERTGYQFAMEGAAGGWRSRAYPSTTMGVMAKFRQLMYDAQALQDHIQYFADANGSILPPKRDDVLESLFPILNGNRKIFANMDSPENFDRLTLLKNEFDLEVILVSGKSMHYRSSELRELDIPILASVEIPEKPEWMNEEGNDDTDAPKSDEENLFRDRQKEAYHKAAQNIRSLLDDGVSVGFASVGMEADELHEHLRRLKNEGGLEDEEILQILTIQTARILDSSETLGSIEPGYNASFTVFNSPFLDEGASVKMVVSNGVIHEY